MPTDLPRKTTFLVKEELSNAIRAVVAGGEVRCAVAYWGKHNFGKDGMPVKEWKIVCDIHSGNTSPEALDDLGAPDNDNLKYLQDLHAKVYLSSLGAIVGSADVAPCA